MTDNDPTERVERVELDLTPTTTPAWVAQVQMPPPVAELPPVPAARGKRLARGTMPPRSGRARLPVVPKPALELPVKLVPPPRAWGRVMRVDLEGSPIARTRAVVARPRRVSPAVLAGLLAAAIVPLAIALTGSSPAQAQPAPIAQPAPVLTAEPTITPLLAPGEGLLAIASTPPCHILIDGHDTGLATPQRELRLPAGHHRITLVDDAKRLEDHSEVEIGATPVSITRDLSAFLR